MAGLQIHYHHLAFVWILKQGAWSVWLNYSERTVMWHIPSLTTFSCHFQEPHFTLPALCSLLVWLWEEAEFQTALTIADFNLSSKSRLVSSLSKDQDENFPVLLWICLSFQENSLHMKLHCLGRNNLVIFSVLSYLVSYLSLHCRHQKLIFIYLHSLLQENLFSLFVLALKPSLQDLNLVWGTYKMRWYHFSFGMFLVLPLWRCLRPAEHVKYLRVHYSSKGTFLSIQFMT